ncbi:MAG TPA: hypothetical protein VFQ61_16505 [Polyangiaceae bacterium]|nr:hypothetical protein [Polyangiaceae bacterium]
MSRVCEARTRSGCGILVSNRSPHSRLTDHESRVTERGSGFGSGSGFWNKVEAVLRTLALKLTGLVSILGCLSAGCGDGEDGAAGKVGPAGVDALVKTTDEPAGTKCEHGGAKIQYGMDNNGNGALDASEIDGTSYACNGAPGQDGQDGPAGENGEPGEDGTDGHDALIITTDEPAGENCVRGGTRFDQGIDEDGDGELAEDEILSSTYVCNGEDGEDGANGSDMLLDVSMEAAGQNCPAGGQKIQAGPDLDGNGSLSAGEVDNTSYVCNGGQGAAGVGNLVRVTDEAAGSNCNASGVKLEIGRDVDANGELAATEVEVTRYLCNGGSAPAGLTSLVNVTAEPAGTNCVVGGQKLETGLDVDRNNTLDAAEVLQTQYLCAGENGAPGATGANGHASLVVITDESPGAQCSAGGKKIQAGLDANDDATLSPSEATRTDYVCHGLAGKDGADGADAHDGLLTVTDEAVGTRCPAGGKRIDVGTDLDDDKVLDAAEISATQYVCNGTNGVSGMNGTNGSNGLVAVLDEPAGANCPAGGERISYGLDDDADGILDLGEIDGTRYVCDGVAGTNGTNGAAGQNGFNSLVAVVNEPAGSNCVAGGEKITYGLDDNRDNTLDAAEVDGTRYVCDGVAGANGTNGTNGTNGLNSLVSVTTENPGANCLAGGQRIQSGLDDDANGTLAAGEVEATAYVCNGNSAI